MRFQKFTATDTNDVKAAVKRIMDHIFTYGLLMLYSWSGQSELNSGKWKFDIKFSILKVLKYVKVKAIVKDHETSRM